MRADPAMQQIQSEIGELEIRSLPKEVRVAMRQGADLRLTSHRQADRPPDCAQSTKLEEESMPSERRRKPETRPQSRIPLIRGKYSLQFGKICRRELDAQVLGMPGQQIVTISGVYGAAAESCREVIQLKAGTAEACFATRVLERNTEARNGQRCIVSARIVPTKWPAQDCRKVEIARTV